VMSFNHGLLALRAILEMGITERHMYSETESSQKKKKKVTRG
jgi:hypothetical protein